MRYTYEVSSEIWNDQYAKHRHDWKSTLLVLVYAAIMGFVITSLITLLSGCAMSQTKFSVDPETGEVIGKGTTMFIGNSAGKSIKMVDAELTGIGTFTSSSETEATTSLDIGTILGTALKTATTP